MDVTPGVGVLVAFTAGLLSILSPCVLPLIPSYLGFVTGMSLDETQQARRTTLVHALLFVIGFSLIFLALGASATVLGRVLQVYRGWISRIGGVLIIAFGLYLLGVVRIGAFDRELRVHFADKPLGYLGTFLVGITFGAGWTPCIGPILGAILIYAASTADLGRGLELMAVYSLGLAVPFLAAAAAVPRFMGVVRRYRRALLWMHRAGGALLVAVGLLLTTGYFTILASYLQALTPAMLRARL